MDGSLTMVTTAATIWLSAQGAEIANSRRVLDLSTVTAVRVVYGASLGVIIRVDYSEDGTDWSPLTTQVPTLVAGTMYRSTWEPAPEFGTNDVLLRVWGSGGLTPAISFVELQYRT